MSDKRCVIFDFDGTLVDSEQVLTESIKALNIPQLKELDKNDISVLKKLGMRDALRTLKIPLYQLPGIVLSAQQEMEKRVYKVQPIPGIADLLQQLHTHDYSLGILTSNSVENVTAVFSSHNLVSLFNFIHSEKNIFGKDRSLQHLLKKYQLSPEEVVYIGDEVRDFEACQKIGVKMVGVAWGYTAADTLREHGVASVAQSTNELLASIMTG